VCAVQEFQLPAAVTDDAVGNRKPQPSPLLCDLVVKNGSNTLSRSTGGIPGPLSDTMMKTS
jgi:hypothetical protein